MFLDYKSCKKFEVEDSLAGYGYIDKNRAAQNNFGGESSLYGIAGKVIFKIKHPIKADFSTKGHKNIFFYII